MDKVLASNIVFYRRKLGMTQLDLAKRAGMSKESIYSYEKCKRWPSPEQVNSIAQALGITDSTLFIDSSIIESFSNEDLLGELSRRITKK